MRSDRKVSDLGSSPGKFVVLLGLTPTTRLTGGGEGRGERGTGPSQAVKASRSLSQCSRTTVTATGRALLLYDPSFILFSCNVYLALVTR